MPVSLSVLVALEVGLLSVVDERLEMQRIHAGDSEATPAVAPAPREAP